MNTVIQGQTVIIGDSKRLSSFDIPKVDFIITSPPYWNLKDYGDSLNEIGGGDYGDYLEDIATVLSECYKVARDGAIMIVNVNNRRSKGKFFPIPMDIANNVHDWTLWDYNIWYIPNALPQPNAYRERLLDNKFESLLVFVKGDSANYKFHKPRVPQKYVSADPRNNKNSRGRCLGNILRIPAYRPPNVRSMNYHVAAYPEELVAFFVEAYTDPADIVLDPFLGSGTTLKVCRTMGRQGIGCEVHEHFIPLISARIVEDWAVPDWTALDIIHSASNEPGSRSPRKAQFSKAKAQTTPLFDPKEK